MSHTWELDETTFTGNSDLSGNIRICNTVTNEVIEVLGRDIIMFVADRLRVARISKLEQMSADEIFGVEDFIPNY